jgi:hypothetical protein
VQILQHSEESSLLEHLTGHSLLEQFILPPCKNKKGSELEKGKAPCNRLWRPIEL